MEQEQDQGSNANFDPNKHFRTMDGRPAKLLFISPVPFMGGETLVVEIEGQALLYFADGRYYTENWCNDSTLVNVPKPRHHAEIAKRYFDEDCLIAERLVSDVVSKRWMRVHEPRWDPADSYRLVTDNGTVIMTSEAEE